MGEAGVVNPDQESSVEGQPEGAQEEWEAPAGAVPAHEESLVNQKRGPLLHNTVLLSVGKLPSCIVLVLLE